VGVGGHCIPVYPHFLFNDEPDLRLPPLAREINEGMASWAVDQVRARLGELRDQPILVLGVAYRADVREDAFSSAFRLRDELMRAGARVHGHDPYFSAEHLRKRGFEPYDFARPVPVRAAVLQAGHAVYGEMDLTIIPQLELLVDGRNALDRARVEAAGIAYVGIGH
jgi:UDP-N-acetyl-D-mannosaminuronic acid dehydrogenase